MSEPHKKKPLLRQHPLALPGSGKQMFQQMDRRSFEATVVDYILTAFDIHSVRWDLIRKQKNETGKGYLTIHRFCERYSDFPMELRVTVFDKLAADVTWSKIFTGPGMLERKMTKFWIESYEDLVEEFRYRPFGTIFRWAHIPHGMVLHNMAAIDRPGVRLVWREKALCLTLEPLAQLTQYFRKKWDPS